MNIDIFNYVQNARNSGIGDDKIKEGLLQAGSSVNEIEDALKSLGQPMPPQVKPKWHPTPAQKWIAIIGVIAILGMAGAYAYVSYLAQRNYDEVARQAQQAEEAMRALEQQRRESPSTSSGQSDVPSDWKTYTNTEYGFEFKYPITQDIYETDSGVRVGTSFWILTIETKQAGRESVFDRNDGTNVREIIFAGKKALEYTASGLFGCGEKIAKSRAIKLVELPAGWESGNETFYDICDDTLTNQILSTFRFIR